MVDPSDEIIEVYLVLLQWDYKQRKFGLTGAGLQKVYALSVDLLDNLEENFARESWWNSHAWSYDIMLGHMIS